MFRNWRCWFGHDYRVRIRFNPGARQVICDRCKRKWAMHDATRSFNEWTGKFEEMYRMFGQWPEWADKD